MSVQLLISTVSFMSLAPAKEYNSAIKSAIAGFDPAALEGLVAAIAVEGKVEIVKQEEFESSHRSVYERHYPKFPNGLAWGGKYVWAKEGVRTRSKTLVHEYAHILFDHRQLKAPTPLAETQAEGTAWLVCKRLGVDMTPQSAAMLLHHSGGDVEKATGLVETLWPSIEAMADRVLSLPIPRSKPKLIGPPIRRG
jgi:hypothetical protein